MEPLLTEQDEENALARRIAAALYRCPHGGRWADWTGLGCIHPALIAARVALGREVTDEWLENQE